MATIMDPNTSPITSTKSPAQSEAFSSFLAAYAARSRDQTTSPSSRSSSQSCNKPLLSLFGPPSDEAKVEHFTPKELAHLMSILPSDIMASATITSSMTGGSLYLYREESPREAAQNFLTHALRGMDCEDRIKVVLHCPDFIVSQYEAVNAVLAAAEAEGFENISVTAKVPEEERGKGKRKRSQKSRLEDEWARDVEVKKVKRDSLKRLVDVAEERRLDAEREKERQEDEEAATILLSLKDDVW
ncbi:hypothetical protein B0J14DRAFT_557426 [Halenospora varia]|nr:hypothetical protein B0J14DRAFT_557426 [Halenospora varia]